MALCRNNPVSDKALEALMKLALILAGIMIAFVCHACARMG